MGYAINSLINESTIDEESVKEMFKVFDEKNIFIETVVLNAADQGLNMEIFKNPLKDFMRVINTNMTWNYCLCEYAARRMKINGGGNIVFVNSNTAYRAIPNRIAYQASKSGQLGMMRGLAFDLGTYNIRVNAVELGEFTIATAKAVKEVRPDAKIIGGVVCNRILNFLNTALKTGMGDYIDYISFHEYTADERQAFEKVSSYRALAKIYNSDAGIIQGESGSQSKSDGNGALASGAWTEEIQAKQLARHTIADLIADVYFMSYFSCMDMIEALNGDVNNKASYLDYA